METDEKVIIALVVVRGSYRRCGNYDAYHGA